MPDVESSPATGGLIQPGSAPIVGEDGCSFPFPLVVDPAIEPGTVELRNGSQTATLRIGDGIEIPAADINITWNRGASEQVHALGTGSLHYEGSFEFEATPEWAALFDTVAQHVAEQEARIRRTAESFRAFLDSLLPPDLRAAGIHFEWVEEQEESDGPPFRRTTTLRMASEATPQPAFPAERATCAHVCGPSPDHVCDVRATGILRHTNLAGGTTDMPICGPCKAAETAAMGAMSADA